MSLIQEVPTRFGTRFHVVERFLDAEAELSVDLDKRACDSDSARKARKLSDLTSRETHHSGFAYPSLRAICLGFRPIHNFKMALQAAHTQTCMHFLPIVYFLRNEVYLRKVRVIMMDNCGIMHPSYDFTCVKRLA